MILKILPNKKKLFGKPKYSVNITILENKNIKCVNCKRNIESDELVFEPEGLINIIYVKLVIKLKGV